MTLAGGYYYGAAGAACVGFIACRLMAMPPLRDDAASAHLILCLFQRAVAIAHAAMTIIPAAHFSARHGGA